MYGGLGMKAGDLDYYAPPSEEKKVKKSKYVLLVNNGTYAEDSLIKLLWTVLKHRFHHLISGEGWRD